MTYDLLNKAINDFIYKVRDNPLPTREDMAFACYALGGLTAEIQKLNNLNLNLIETVKNLSQKDETNEKTNS